MEDVIIWDRALSAEEILELYNQSQEVTRGKSILRTDAERYS